eukprot:SAG11_NODE_10330_length_839_cov_1.094595_1_plen_183_part_01
MGSHQNNACRALVAASNCRHREGVDSFLRRNKRRTEILDIEELGQLGRQETFCPFFASRELQQNADIIFLPYNYLIDRRARRSLESNMDLSNAALIFDEAHNLESLCSDAASIELRAADIMSAIRDVDIAVRMVEHGDVDAQCNAGELAALKGMLENFRDKLDALPLASSSSTLEHEGRWAME